MMIITMNDKDYINANREAWNEVAPVHQKARGKEFLEEVKSPDYSALDAFVTGKLREIGFEGKSVAQLCCNNGRECISLRNLGSGPITGFDISDEAIAEARKLNEIAGSDCEFVRTDVFEIDKKHYGKYDIVFITVGALSWLPDLERFFKVVYNLLKPDGYLLIYEMHPFLYTIPCKDELEFDPEQPFKIEYSYFKTEPWAEDSGIDYVGGTTYQGKTSYSFTQKISDIINPIVKNDITLVELNEYPHDISSIYPFLEKEQKLPLSFILIGKKN
ncbi:MAG: methyltransferase domain-containing protein [candidate division Zixibacteria bacterium]|nr:methyltransferase domain-containing protein [candidate division Zixibacteria bacterium]